MWIQLTGEDGTPALINLHQVRYIDTGYEEPGCRIFFRDRDWRHVSETIEEIREAFRRAF